MFEIGFVLFIMGVAILFIGLVIDYTTIDYFGPPALVCLLISLIIMGATIISNENTQNISATQTTQSIQEQSDINNYNYCPTCGNKVKED